MVEPIHENNNSNFEEIYKYWLSNSQLPKLRDIALEVCSIPTSSTDCERLFSIANFVIGPNRQNMTKENIEMIVMLYANYEITKNAVR